MKYKIPPTVFIQEIDEDVILLDTESQEYFSLNGVGKNILDLISKNLPHEEIIEELAQMYEVDKPQIESDLLNFIKALEEKQLIRID
jgi:DNA-directed RNA polymerase delta subunit